MKTDSYEFLVAARKIFQEVFDLSQEVAEKALRLAKDDTGEWAPTSLLVVYKEEGVPDRYYYPRTHSLWEEANKRLSELIGKPVFLEEINAGVSALYYV